MAGNPTHDCGPSDPPRDIKKEYIPESCQPREKRILGNRKKLQGRFDRNLGAGQDGSDEEPESDRQGYDHSKPQPGNAYGDVILEYVLDAVDQWHPRHDDHSWRHQAERRRPANP